MTQNESMRLRTHFRRYDKRMVRELVKGMDTGIERPGVRIAEGVLPVPVGLNLTVVLRKK